MTTRTVRVPLDARINLSVRTGHGSVRIDAVDGLTEAVVSLEPAPGCEDLVERMTVGLAGRTLQVHAPRQGGLADLVAPWRPRWEQGVAVTVSVPSGTAVKVATFTAGVTITGRCGSADIASGAPEAIELDEIEGDLQLRYGSSRASVRRVTGSAQVRSGAGDVHLGDVRGDLDCVCGSGRLDADEVHGRLRARSGAGAASLRAVYGDVDLASGSGDVAIGLPAGVTASVDLNTGCGEVRSDLPVTDSPAERRGAITVRVRTGRGDVVLSRAA